MDVPVPDDPYTTAERAAARLRQLTDGQRFDVAVVLGSGWGPAADALGSAAWEANATELPGFPPPAVEGHAGRVRAITSGAVRTLVFLGRTHLYERRDVAAVAHAVRVAAAAGCRTAVLTNGAGSLREEWKPGTPVLVADHLNLTAVSPLTGARFVDLTDLYPPRLRALCREVDPSLAEGVYAQMPGPHFETPAEIRMLRALGADLVGMSTALEAVAAREAGLEVLGVSLVTNLAAGLTGAPLDHEEVLAAGRTSAVRVGRLLADVVGKLG